MNFAYTKEGNKIHIKDYKKNSFDVYCLASHKVIAKQGEIKRWHFSHVGESDCRFGKGKTEWHLWWQERVKKENLEIMMKRDDSFHIADIVNNEGIVIEIQHSNMSEETIRERQDFYKNMIWIFDCMGGKVIIEKVVKDMMKMKINGSSFFLKAKKPFFIDLGHRGLIEVIKHKGNIMVGRKWTLSDFDRKYFKDILIEGHDTRDGKPEYDVSKKATKEEILKF